MGTQCLLVVDVQQGILDDGNKAMGENLLINIKKYLDRFREEGKTVVYIRHDSGPGKGLAYGTSGWQIAEEVKPLENEKIFDKNFNSAFFKTGLEGYLKEKGVDTLYIVGMQTEYCVDTTIKSAFEREYKIYVPEKCHMTLDSGNYKAEDIMNFYTNKIWRGRFAEII